jgi:hypothetical protein
MDGWHFTRGPEGWQWHRLADGESPNTSSARAFPSLLECLEDAKRNGYSLILQSENLPLPFSDGFDGNPGADKPA